MEPFVHDATLDMHIARDQLLRTLDGLSDSDWSRGVPYGSRTLHDVLAHIAAADQVWALAAQGLLKGEADQRAPLSRAEAASARQRAIERGRRSSISELRDEMDRRRQLLLALYDLLEKRHLVMRLPTFGEAHNSVRERIWLGYHDRLHRADIERAMRMAWHPPKLDFPPALRPIITALSPDETLYVIYSVDAVQWERPARGLEWTNRQLLAHIATGDWVFQGHLRHILETGEVAGWADIDAGNAERIAQRRFSNDTALVEEYLSMRHETFTLLSQLNAEHLALSIELWWPPEAERRRTILDYVMAFERHDHTHRDQLRPAMKYATSTR